MFLPMGCLTLWAQDSVSPDYFFQPISPKLYNQNNFLHELSEGVDGRIWQNTARGVSVFDGFNFKVIPINLNGSGNDKSLLIGNEMGQFACTTPTKEICIIETDGSRSTHSLKEWLPEKLMNNKSPYQIYDMTWGTGGVLHLMVSCFEEVFYMSFTDGLFKRRKLYFENYPFGVFTLKDGSFLKFQNRTFQSPSPMEISKRSDSIVYFNPERLGNQLKRGLSGRPEVFDILVARTTNGFCFSDRKNLAFSGQQAHSITWESRVNDIKFWKGKIYVGSASGLHEYTEETKQIHLLLKGNVLSHFHDRSGNIYVSLFDKGLWIGKPQYFNVRRPSKTHKVSGFTIIKSFNNRLMLSSMNKLFIFQNGHTKYITEISDNYHISDFYFDSLGNGFILGSGAIYKANMYTGATERISFMDKNRFVFAKRLVKISDTFFAFGGPGTVGFYKNDEILYASGSDFGRRRNNPLRFSKNIYAIYKWSPDTLLISGETGSYKMNVNTYEWNRCDGTLGNSEVVDYITLGDTTIFATYGRGLLVQTKDSLVQITKENGLSANFISSMAFNKGKLFLSIGNAVNVVDINNQFKVSELNENHGLKQRRILSLSVFNDSLFIASDDGLFYNNVQKLTPKVSTNNRWHFDISLNGAPANIADLEMVNKSRNLEIEAYPIIPHALGNIKVFYRIEEFGAVFTEMKNNGVNFSAMKPGKYQISFQAIDGFSQEPVIDEITLPVHIKAKFHETVAFGILLTLVCIALIYLYFSRVVYRLKQRNKLQAQLIEVEQHALKSQMNPHFMFNSLNAIQGYISRQDKVSAFTYIAKFARLIRWYLDNTTQKDVPIVEEVNALRDYMDLESMRFNGLFTYSIAISEEVMENKTSIRFPNMMLQPTIENAILHGVRHLTTGGLLKVGVVLDNDFVRVEVEDNGIGRKQSRVENQRKERYHKSVATANVNRRTDLINQQFPGKIEYWVDDLEDHEAKAIGTKVTFRYNWL